MIGTTATVYDTCFLRQRMCVIAATWNVELAEEMGKGPWATRRWSATSGAMEEAVQHWLVRPRRQHPPQPFGGRNWEYYSEDSFLSGRMAAQVIQGAKSRGVYTYVKHFAVNDQETHRDANGLITWLSEQSLREIYLRPFEMAGQRGRLQRHDVILQPGSAPSGRAAATSC